MSTSIPTDDPKRSLTLAQPDNLPHIGLVGDTYTITVTGDETDGHFCIIDMHIPPGGGPPPHRHDFEETTSCSEGENVPRQESNAAGAVNIPANRISSQRVHQPGTHALYLPPCRAEKFFIGWGAGRHAYDAPAEAGRQRAGRIIAESEGARTQVPTELLEA